MENGGQPTPYAAESLALATEHSLPFWIALETVTHGWTLIEQKQQKKGSEQIRRGTAALFATGSKISYSPFLYALAQAYGKTGRIEEGLHTVAEALTFTNQTGEHFYEAELYRLQGELTLRQPKAASPKSKPKEQVAEECFLRAIEIARQQKTKAFELRATMSLSRLWRQQHKRQEAYHTLSVIYNWFTEGSDSADLQEAASLLGELQNGDSQQPARKSAPPSRRSRTKKSS